MDNRAFYDLPPEYYPLKITLFRGEEILHVIDVPGPGEVQIPGYSEGGVSVKLELGNGEVQIVEAPQQEAR